MIYFTDINAAESLLAWAEEQNPGPWIQHSKNVADAAYLIAKEIKERCFVIDPEIAYICGLLHDIGRYKGKTPSVVHSYDGYVFLMEKGYEGTANVCITHSFVKRNLNAIIGWEKIELDIQKDIINVLDKIPWSIYDKIVTLCDSIADSSGYTIIEKRLVSVAMRHGINQYFPDFWRGYFELKHEIDMLAGCNIYELLPDITKSTLSN